MHIQLQKGAGTAVVGSPGDPHSITDSLCFCLRMPLMGSCRVGKGWPEADASRSCDANSSSQCQPGYLLAPPQPAALVSLLPCSALFWAKQPSSMATWRGATRSRKKDGLGTRTWLCFPGSNSGVWSACLPVQHLNNLISILELGSFVAHCPPFCSLLWASVRNCMQASYTNTTQIYGIVILK